MINFGASNFCNLPKSLGLLLFFQVVLLLRQWDIDNCIIILPPLPRDVVMVGCIILVDQFADYISCYATSFCLV